MREHLHRRSVGKDQGHAKLVRASPHPQVADRPAAPAAAHVAAAERGELFVIEPGETAPEAQGGIAGFAWLIAAPPCLHVVPRAPMRVAHAPQP